VDKGEERCWKAEEFGIKEGELFDVKVKAPNGEPGLSIIETLAYEQNTSGGRDMLAPSHAHEVVPEGQFWRACNA